MPNHIHALIQPPEPNLARGMQHWLSGYANWYAKPNQRTGHLYQGRYNAILVEDAGYYWTLSRYIHLNLCADYAVFRSAAAGRDMAAWRPGYADDGRRTLYESWGRGLVCQAWTVYRIWSVERNNGTRSPRGGAKRLQILNFNFT
ncbi:transposase [Novipirellula maiorica]|uniref:transposase n=1 Tax=Novipirellula maiorica TaxID=1265734 RepID=UPI001360B203|nr:transposase [Rhodopirellula maiorica]